MRKVKYYLLTEVRSKSWVSRFLSARVFDKTYWSWNRDCVARGAGWGAIAAIAPVPMQTFWGIGLCLWRKGNIPVAVLMAWLSPPGFIILCVPSQWYLGMWILDKLGLGTSGASWHMMESFIKELMKWEWSLEPFKNLSVGMIGLEFLLGWVVSSIAIGLVCYWGVQICWRAASLFGRKKEADGQQ